jgi:hypothetical protein
MNIDELKNDWNNEDTNSPEITEAHLITKTKSPIDSIRKNVLFEGVFYLITGIVLFALVLSLNSEPLTHVTAIVSSLVFLVNIVLFVVFAFLFYVKMKRFDFGKSSSLREFIFRSKLAIELYRAYSFTLVPLAMIVSLTMTSPNIVDHIYRAFQEGRVQTWTIFFGVGIYCLGLIVGYWLTNYWLKQAYGKHIEVLDEIHKELN